MYKIVYYKAAVKDIEKLKGAKLDKKARGLIELIKENPYQNPPPYEGLLGNLQGLYSRRINIQHRLVYEVYNEPFEENGITYYATLNITLHNPEKFDVEEVRHEYVTKLEAAAQRSAEKAEKDRIKAEKAEKRNRKKSE